MYVGSINFQRPYLYKELVLTNTGQFLTATYDELALDIFLSMGIIFLPKVQATFSFTQMSGIRPNIGKIQHSYFLAISGVLNEKLPLEYIEKGKLV